MEQVAKAAERIARLEPRLAEARRELHAAILEAHKDGHSTSVIAKVSSLSRQRVDQIIKRG